MKTLSNNLIATYCLLATISAVIIGCQTNDNPTNNGLAISNATLDATFTIDQTNASQNKYVLNANDKNVLANIWNLNDGNNPKNGSSNYSVFIPDAGTYNIQHTSVGRGGASDTKSQTLVVPTSDPISGNLVQGGRFQNVADHAKWTILNIAGSHINWTFGNGFANVSGASPTAYGQQGIYQAMQIIANKEYFVDMNIKGNACLSSWFEVYIGTAVPQQNNDYNSGGKRISISTFGCLMSNAFDGKLLTLSCDGSGGKKIKFPTSGTVYLVIRSGGFNNNTLGTGGIRISNVEFRGEK